MKFAGNVAPKLRLGYSSQAWLERAIEAMSQFDNLVSRISRIGDKAVREELTFALGASQVLGSAMERYQSLKMDIAESQRGAVALNDELQQNRVIALEAIIAELRPQVEEAEAQSGSIEPVSLPQVTVAGIGISQSSLIAGGIALLALVVIPLLVD